MPKRNKQSYWTTMDGFTLAHLQQDKLWSSNLVPIGPPKYHPFIINTTSGMENLFNEPFLTISTPSVTFILMEWYFYWLFSEWLSFVAALETQMVISNSVMVECSFFKAYFRLIKPILFWHTSSFSRLPSFFPFSSITFNISFQGPPFQRALFTFDLFSHRRKDIKHRSASH